MFKKYPATYLTTVWHFVFLYYGHIIFLCYSHIVLGILFIPYPFVKKTNLLYALEETITGKSYKTLQRKLKIEQHPT